MRKTSIYPDFGHLIVGGIFDGYIYTAEKPSGAVVLTRKEDEHIVISDKAWANLPDFDFAAPLPPIKVGDRVYASSNKFYIGTVKIIEGEIAAVLWDKSELKTCNVSVLKKVCDC